MIAVDHRKSAQTGAKIMTAIRVLLRAIVMSKLKTLIRKRAKAIPQWDSEVVAQRIFAAEQA
jgi:hypothetical protein